jgi:hypothetical protein
LKYSEQLQNIVVNVCKTIPTKIHDKNPIAIFHQQYNYTQASFFLKKKPNSSHTLERKEKKLTLKQKTRATKHRICDVCSE